MITPRSYAQSPEDLEGDLFVDGIPKGRVKYSVQQPKRHSGYGVPLISRQLISVDYDVQSGQIASLINGAIHITTL